MKKFLFLPMLFFALMMNGQTKFSVMVDPSVYLSNLKAEMQIAWPKNRTIHIVFHGHSVPAGYFKTPAVHTLESYPHLFLKKLKAIYPFAVVNVIVTAIGGENAVSGAARFEQDVLTLRPDVVFIDYALNDRRIGLEKAYEAWNQMIKQASDKGIKVILMTPSPDISVNYADPENLLRKHSEQIRKISAENQVGLVDVYKVFEFLYPDKEKLSAYMAQVNHPNEHGHELIANEIIKWFK